MKKIVALIMAILMMVTMTACGQKQSESRSAQPQISQMKAISELAVMECYYHNVAKYEEKDAEGMLWWEKDKKFWVEYSGVVRVGIDASLVNIEIEDTQVEVTLPGAKLLSCKVDSASLSEDSFIVAKKSADITAEDQKKAFEEAQVKMRNEAENNSALLASAQQKAQSLLEQYIINIGDTVGKQYTIKWNYLDEAGTISDGATTEAEQTTTAA